jgi:hypothetical protein
VVTVFVFNVVVAYLTKKCPWSYGTPKLLPVLQDLAVKPYPQPIRPVCILVRYFCKNHLMFPSHLLLCFRIIFPLKFCHWLFMTLLVLPSWFDCPNTMELGPCWEAATCAATQELLNTLWNPEIRYHVHKCSTGSCPDPDSPSHTTPFLSEIHFDIIHPPTSWPS